MKKDRMKREMKRRPGISFSLVVCLATAIVLLPATGMVVASTAVEEPNHFLDRIGLTERVDGFYTMRNESDGALILRTARLLRPGDRFIDPDNNHYQVVRLEDDTAWAHPVEDDGGAPAGAYPDDAATLLPVQAEGQRVVGIYHSHGAESYVPSDGSESIDQGGGILRVGDAFATGLERDGVEVIHSRETHVPHDAGAYNRSRRTAVDLLGEQPDAIFDVHRDAVPAEEYDAEVGGHEVVSILFVVGRQNQNMDGNQAFARSLKNSADSRFPGLIKGILLADGNFNQDLAPRSLLLEVGAHENSREQAEGAVNLFADVVSGFLYRVAGGPEKPVNRESGIAMQSALKMLLALAIAFFLYLLISAGSWEAFKRKVAFFFQREFADLKRGFNRRDRGGGDREQ